jgi:hypothetical protein
MTIRSTLSWRFGSPMEARMPRTLLSDDDRHLLTELLLAKIADATRRNDGPHVEACTRVLHKITGYDRRIVIESDSEFAPDSAVGRALEHGC